MTERALPAMAFALALTTQLSFVWAIRRFFVASGGPQPGMRAIAGLGTSFALWQLASLGAGVVNPQGDGTPALVGAGLYAEALGLFWWAVAANRTRPLSLAFSKDAPEHLVAWGPYRRMRHPFYAAYSLAWLAGAVTATEPGLLVPLVVMGVLYVRAARLEEAKFAASPLADAYAAYRARTGMFWPSLRA
jgi:protein-S-isoprenylcysteine O-methyltransferase Ste14